MTALVLAGALALAAAPARRPVVVELFSSEGCSSCPAADEVLRGLQRDQPLADAEVIALEEHVDYWNDLGWADPFSSADFSARQGRYAQAMGRDGVYTPQAVVDGANEVIGSHEGELRKLVEAAAKRPAATVALALEHGALKIDVRDLPTDAKKPELWLALTEAELSTDVPRGENRGRTLQHAPVVRRLERLGDAKAGAQSVPVALPSKVHAASARWVAFVQEAGAGRILGAAAITASTPDR